MIRPIRLTILIVSLIFLAASVQAALPQKEICPAPKDHAARQAAVQAACGYFNEVPGGWGLHSAFDAAGQVITCIHFDCVSAPQQTQGASQPAVLQPRRGKIESAGPRPSQIKVQPAVPLKRFRLEFDDAYLVHQPGRSGVQIAAQGNVLSYGNDWQVRQLKPYLFHLKQSVWKDFYWKVNTSRHEIYQVTGGQFGQLGGKDQKIAMRVDTVASADKPARFFLRFNDAYIVHPVGQSSLQVAVQGKVLSYGNDWQVRQMKPYLFHLKQNTWKGFYWKVNTSRKEAYLVKGGQFGQLGGQDTRMNITVDPVY